MLVGALVLALSPAPASARNIVLTNDDGLTSNVKALYEALKAQGHDVIVSVPCSNQSGMGASIRFMRPLTPLKADCLNAAAKAGEAGAGPMTRAGLGPDFFYVDGTPVMAMLYGIDIVAAERWGKAPDLVLSGPNEGQNVGHIVMTSGTVSNAQLAASRGIPAVALSAGHDTVGDDALANPKSAEIARLSGQLVAALHQRAVGKALLPPGIALNVNFPDRLEGAKWKLARIGTYNSLMVRFVPDISSSPSALARGLGQQHAPGIIVDLNSKPPTAEQTADEAAVYRKDIAVSVMQVGYDHLPAARKRVARQLRGFLGK
jgi:5'-nucleotidase